MTISTLENRLKVMDEENIEVAHGQTILEQGEQGSGFYILQSGSLEVIKDEILLSVLMYPGTIFGEMSDILGKARTCTVKAKKASKITHIHAGDMTEFIQNNPRIGMKIIKTLASRLDRTTQKLTDTTRESPLWTVRK